MSVWVIFDCSTNMPIDICDGNIIDYMRLFYCVDVVYTRFLGDTEPNVELVFQDKDLNDVCFEHPYKYYAVPVTQRYPID